MKQRLILILLLAISLFTYAEKPPKSDKNKTLIPESYEVYEEGDWQLRIFYWNRMTANRITHYMLYLRGLPMPDGIENDILYTTMGPMRFVLRQDRNSGVSGWMPEDGFLLEAYRVHKTLTIKDFKQINVQNNPDLVELTEEEQLQRLYQQQEEWKNGHKEWGE